jgi:hypothetical protein
MALSPLLLRTVQQPSVGTKKDQPRSAIVLMGQQSNKAFHMPNGAVEVATAMDELHHEL